MWKPTPNRGIYNQDKSCVTDCSVVVTPSFCGVRDVNCRLRTVSIKSPGERIFRWEPGPKRPTGSGLVPSDLINRGPERLRDTDADCGPDRAGEIRTRMAETAGRSRSESTRRNYAATRNLPPGPWANHTRTG